MKSEDSKAQAAQAEGARDAGDADISVPDSAARLPAINKTHITVKYLDGVSSKVETQLEFYDAVENVRTSGMITPCTVGQSVNVDYVKPGDGNITLQITSQEHTVSVRFSTESVVLVTLVGGVVEELFWDLKSGKMAWREKKTPGDNFVVSGAGMFKVGRLDKFSIYVHKSSEPVSPEGGVAKRMHMPETVSPQEHVAKRMRKPEGGVGGPG